ncbi:helix-turn-helix domain-containing protein [Aquimarina aggregata]|uniref:helix-turn-helix domain-containing protein n=1 Tax=Aquimarina aggregata TaxID=1642818 RepID=UPI00248F9533|nr:helix-turn-helix transcriptional regulator [Aquimarina aggregata]
MKNTRGNTGAASALYVWNGMSAFWGTSFHTDPHRHDTLQLVFDIDKSFHLKDKSTQWTSYSSAIIKTSHLHQLDSNNSIQLFIYLDKDSDYAQELDKKYLSNKNISDLKDSNINKISTSFFKKLLVSNDCNELFKGFLTIIQHLIDFKKPVQKDERIVKAISFIINSEKQIKVKDIADHICLSESRLRYLFKKQVGQPIQSFMVWMKVINSLNLVLKGNPLTEAAYDVGFWDASHMNRSYKELLGVAPSTIKKYENELKIILCSDTNFHTFKTEILENWNSKEPTKTIII